MKASIVVVFLALLIANQANSSPECVQSWYLSLHQLQEFGEVYHEEISVAIEATYSIYRN